MTSTHTLDSNKKYPSATPEMAKIFGIDPVDDNSRTVAASSEAPSHLPVVSVEALPHTTPTDTSHNGSSSSHSNEASHASTAENLADAKNTAQAAISSLANNKVFKVFKTVIPYILVFGLGLFLYFFFFSNVNFSSLFKSKPAAVTQKDSLLLTLEKQNTDTYNNWIKGFYYDVSDPKVLDANADNSGNGLSNFQKFMLNLNPKSYDTLGLGRADSEDLSMGINPNTGNPLSDSQKQIIDKYFDMEVIMNKLTIAKLQKGGLVAGAYTNSTTQSTAPVAIPTQNNQNYVAPQTQNYQPVPTGANLAAVSEAQPLNGNDVQIDMHIPGRLSVPSLHIDAPLIWSQSPDTFEDDLKSGVIHYPGTALPGEIGTSYIAGHSSNYAWVKGNYNHVFTYLGDLANNTSFTVTVVQTNGKNAIFHYIVTGNQQYQPDDIAQFKNSGKSVVALSTCWPVGTTSKRLVVYGELTQVEK